MSRIDAIVATQVGDASRPRQSVQDTQLQAKEVQRKDLKDAGQGQDVKADDVRAAAARLQQVVEAASGRTLNFDVEEKLKELVVTVKDVKTGEVVRQIPGKETIKLATTLQDWLGSIFNEKA